MKHIRTLFAALLLAPLIALHAADAPKPSSKPNILHIHADDHRADGLRALGNPLLVTPSLDSLVERGMTFTRCYTMGSMIGAVCTPSRTMMLTGRSWQRIPGAPAAAPNAKDPTTFLPRVIQAAGYQTWHMGKAGNGFPAGLAEFQTSIRDEGKGGERAGCSRRLADGTIEFLKSRTVSNETKPFYIYIAPPVPHDPRSAEPQFHKRYDPAKIPLSPAFLPQHPFDNGEMTVRDEALAPWPRTPEDTKQQLADFYACVTGLDHHIGRIFAELKASGQWDNTIIVFSGDNGLSMGEHGLFGKQNLYEFGGMHVPLVVAGPGITKGKSEAFVYLMDLFPTLAEIAGAKTPDGVEGKSLAPILSGKEKKIRDVLYTAYRHCQRAIRDDRWKLIRYPLVDCTQLFDLSADPRELNNLADKPEHKAKVAELTGLLQIEMVAHADTTPLTVANPAPAEWTPPAPGTKSNRPTKKKADAVPASATAGILQLTGDAAAGGPGKFAAEELRRQAEAHGMALGDNANAIRVALTVEKAEGAVAQSYSIGVQNEGGRRIITVRGADAAGVMYGGLDVAEAIRTGTFDSLKDSAHKPHIAQRGIKFNIPLDLRTPSYTDCSDAAQANIPEMWEREFWTAFLDAMARHRYNVLSLWSLHPFPSLVKVPEFPEVALDDVWRTRAKLDDTFSFAGNDMVRPAMLADHEVVKRISIDEKIEFWRWVMQQAADRGIRVYFFTWNVFTFGAEGKHGITNDLGNDITKKYFRASVREMVKTYPLLAGMGITAGEGMPEKMDSKEKERWLWDTYGEGVRDALKHEPKREFGMIHRFHWTAQSDILDAFKDYPGRFDFSFKYSVAHMYSITKPPFIQPLLENMAPGRKTWLTVRNDDIYTFRFGDPAYIRDYIVNIPPADKIAGFYMGPDGYVWGRDFLERNPAPGPRPLVMEKQWYSFALVGRLAYEPALPDSHFERLLAARHPKAPAPQLFRALQGAGQVMPLITRFFWGDIDLKWYPEACWSHRRSKGQGFYTVRHFMEGSSMPGANVLCIRDWRSRLAARQPMEQTTPLEIADALEKSAAETFSSLNALSEAAKQDSELQKTVNDCEALALLGRYYASKIRGACALAQFDANGDKSEHDAALRHLGDALTHWKKYAAIRDAHYVPALYNRVGYVDITALTEMVAADVNIAQSWKPGTLKDDGKRAGSEKGFRK